MSREETHSEKNLLLRIAAGDETAMDTVFAACFGKLVSYAVRLIRNKAEAEDMAMRALGKLWQRAAPERIEALNGFLYRTVHNSCIDYIRHERVKNRLKTGAAVDDFPAEEYIETNYIRAELVKLIYDEMDHLPDKCGEVVKLYFIHGLSHAEIAQRMNIEEKTVRNQKARALSLLRTILVKKHLLLLFYHFF